MTDIPRALTAPADQLQRERALAPGHSVLVQAPAGSGKTDLLTRRFLRLLAQVDSPGEVVAMTFTIAAAAEMRHRILASLERAAAGLAPDDDPLSMQSLARAVLDRSNALGWNLIDTPAQLRIATIDSFCRELALQQPLLSGLGAGLNVIENPTDLYRRAARRTLEHIGSTNTTLSSAIESLLKWRDNSWWEMENLLVKMLPQRDRWMHDFVLNREPDWPALRARLERPFANAVREALLELNRLLDLVPHARDEAHSLACFACSNSQDGLHRDLAEMAEFPCGPFSSIDDLEAAQAAFNCLADLVLTGDVFRRSVNVNHGFPPDFPNEKSRVLALITDLKRVPSLESALAALRELPPVRYSDDEWRIVRACFTLLHRAAVELSVVFAEAGATDFTEVAQIALRVLSDDDGRPSDAAINFAGNIRHLLVDEFQDTSRRQHELLGRIVAAWPDRDNRTIFVVGDPMQSIYFFRDADAELFPRVRVRGLDVLGDDPLLFDFAPLTSNFRTAPALVTRLNNAFAAVFAVPDGSDIEFTPAEPPPDNGREDAPNAPPRFHFHPRFILDPALPLAVVAETWDETIASQTEEILALIRSHLPAIHRARQNNTKFRIGVLARKGSVLAPIVEALRLEGIPFRAVGLEKLAERAEIQDALSLARALLNPEDRVAWLGVLRAPWCALSLDDLHTLVSADQLDLLVRPVPWLLEERAHLLSRDGQAAAARVLAATQSAPALRDRLPNSALGTWLEQVWLRLGGAACVDATARANLDLLWSLLDRLPGGAQDLLGPALDSALRDLNALPDPEASSDCGVQIMTIHKAKGLEFEVVIVPGLEAGQKPYEPNLLSWLERGVARPDDTGEPTEFLIAPIQTKGAKGGAAKRWVDRVRGAREKQEDRRILYVAATRAREELHLFARPACSLDKNGTLVVDQPNNNLLAAAWPALSSGINQRFAAWRHGLEQKHAQSAGSLALAAAAAASPPQFTPIFRLPANFTPREADTSNLPTPPATIASSERLYERHEGGLLSRAQGRAIHALMEELARLRATHDWESARAALSAFAPRVTALLRAAGIDARRSASLAAESLGIALAASRHPLGQWVLDPHADAASEVRWAGTLDGSIRTVQVDRVFRAGSAPLATGDQHWWIVDYKSADPGSAADLSKLRPFYAPQLELYASVLRLLHGTQTPIRAGIYYPRALKLDWWEIEPR